MKYQCYGTSFQCYGIRFKCYAMMLVENDMPELSVMKRSRSQYEKRFIHNFLIEKYLSNSIFLAGVIICVLAHSTFSLCRKKQSGQWKVVLTFSWRRRTFGEFEMAMLAMECIQQNENSHRIKLCHLVN